MLAQCALRRRRLLRMQPSRFIHCRQRSPESSGRRKSVHLFGGRVEIDNTLIVIDGDDGIADLRQHLATNAICFGI